MGANPTLEDQVRKTLALLVAVVAVLSGLLSGCSGDVGTAARVGDTSISQHKVDELAAELAALPEFQGKGVVAAQLAPTALTLLVHGELGHQLAQKQPQVQVPAQARAQILSEMPASVLSNEKLRTVFTDQAEFALRANMLGSSVYTVLGQVPVDLNPRYGAWDTENLVVASTNESLSTPWKPQK